MTGPTLAKVARGPRDEVQDGIVAGLEEALAAAKAGEYEAGLLIFDRADSPALTHFILGTRDATALIGKLEILKHELLTGGKTEGT